MKVVLTRKLADCLDGVDVTDRRVGDMLDLPGPEARLLVAEDWAIPDRRHVQARVRQERRAASSRHNGSHHDPFDKRVS